MALKGNAGDLRVGSHYNFIVEITLQGNKIAHLCLISQKCHKYVKASMAHHRVSGSQQEAT